MLLIQVVANLNDPKSKYKNLTCKTYIKYRGTSRVKEQITTKIASSDDEGCYRTTLTDSNTPRSAKPF